MDQGVIQRALRADAILSDGSHTINHDQDVGIGITDKLKADRFAMCGLLVFRSGIVFANQP